jgi:hypothetical protein
VQVRVSKTMMSEDESDHATAYIINYGALRMTARSRFTEPGDTANETNRDSNSLRHSHTRPTSHYPHHNTSVGIPTPVFSATT